MRRAMAFAVLVRAALASGSVASPPPNGVFQDVTKTSGVSVRIEPDLRRLKLIATMVGGVAYYPAEIYEHLNVKPFAAPPPVSVAK